MLELAHDSDHNGLVRTLVGHSQVVKHELFILFIYIRSD